jgi:F5/8 type C domain-containing protein
MLTTIGFAWGGGATGRALTWQGGPDFTTIYTGANYLTGSLPSVDANGKEDWKGWRVLSRDHIHAGPFPLVVYAIGIKVQGLTRDELISNLSISKSSGMAVSHPEFRTYLSQGYLLIGGGFNVLDQPEGGGNIATASFPDSTFTWRARSQDMEVVSPSRLEISAIGIKSQISVLDPTPNDPNHRTHWNVVTSYSSTEFLYHPPDPPGSLLSDSIAQPLPGFALCGGGGAVHPGNVGGYLFALEPTTLENPVTASDPVPPVLVLDPFNQTFTARSTSAYTIHTNTAYAMGIKFVPAITAAEPKPGPGPAPGIQCDRLIPIQEVKFDVTLNPTMPPDLVKDGNLNTKWMSKNIENPSIELALIEQKPLCRVDIGWGDTNKYKFTISVGTSPGALTMVYSGQRTGTSITPEQYNFPTPVPGRYLKITVTESTPGSVNSIAHISEIAVFSNV